MVATNGSGSITFDGLASGLKTNEIIDAMVEAQKAPLRQLDRREEVLEAHRAAYEEIASLIGVIDEKAGAMSASTAFIAYTARSSDEDVLRVTAGQGARSGIYAIDVEQLASSQRTLSSPQSSDVGPSSLKAGSLGWRVGESHYTVEVKDGQSLESVANAINEAGGQMFATLLFDGEAHRIQLTGAYVGEINAMMFDEDLCGLDFHDPKNLVQPAQDAVLVLDGVTRVRRSENVINDILTGLTFSLEDPGHVRVRVTEDAAAMVEQIEAFAEAYNAAVTAISGHTRFEGKHDPKKLSGDSTLSTLTRSLQTAVSRPISNCPGPINALSAIGLSTARDGTLDVDKSKLMKVVTQQAAVVAKVFGRDYSRNTPGIAQRVHDVVRQYATAGSGQLHTKSKTIENQNEAVVRRRAQMQVHADKYEEGLRKKFTDLERNMAKLKSQNSFLQAQSNNGDKK
jgi:flagellar hook-associated protein 2